MSSTRATGGPDSSGQDPGLARQLDAAARETSAIPPHPRSRHRIVNGIDAGAEALTAACLLAITTIILANVIARYVFNTPLGWTDEVATSLLTWLTMLGTFVTARRRDLIVVGIMSDRLPRRVRSAVATVVAFVGALGLGYLAWTGVQLLTTFGGDTTPYLGVPKGWTWVAIPIGAAGIAAVVLMTLRAEDPAPEPDPRTTRPGADT